MPASKWLSAVLGALLCTAPISLQAHADPASVTRDPHAPPTDPKARALYDEAVKEARLRNFDPALVKLRASAEIEPAPTTFYSMAQCARQLQKWTDATWYFREYKRLADLNPSQQKQIDDLIASMADGVKAEQAAATKRDEAQHKEPTNVEGAPSSSPAPSSNLAPSSSTGAVNTTAPSSSTPLAVSLAPSRREHDWSDPLGWGIAGVGVVGGVVAGYLAYRGNSLVNDSNHEPDTMKRNSLRDQGSTRRTAAVVTGIAGGVVLIVGAVHIGLHTRMVIESRPVTLDVTPTSNGVAAFGTF